MNSLAPARRARIPRLRGYPGLMPAVPGYERKRVEGHAVPLRLLLLTLMLVAAGLLLYSAALAA